MSKVAIANMAWGFVVILIAALGGVINAFDLTDAHLKGAALVSTWQIQLLQSAHGHSNLFGMLHILFGLTIPYSRYSSKITKWQSLGLLGGTVAMGPLLIVRAMEGPTASTDPVGIIMGILLTGAMVSLGSHGLGLTMRALR